MIKKSEILLLVFFILCNFITIFGQESVSKNNKKWFLGIDLGVQMSGIKSEDFVSSNYSSLIKVLGGKWLNSNIGIQVGYQGRHFNAIADNDKHFYDFYFIEGILDAKNILSINKKDKRFYELIFHAGFGLFQNHYYGNYSVHGILGSSNNFLIADELKLKFDVGAIVGWDIYQGNDDILPSISLGLVYTINKK